MRLEQKLHSLLLITRSILVILATAAFCSGSEPESNVRFNALFITNFAKFMQWPDQQDSTALTVTVIGNDPVCEELRKIAAITRINGRMLRVAVAENSSAVEHTHILYIPENKSKHVGDAVKRFDSKPVLIVTNKKGCAELGAGININNLYWKLRYEINITALKKNGLVAMPELFKLGKVVE